MTTNIVFLDARKTVTRGGVGGAEVKWSTGSKGVLDGERGISEKRAISACTSSLGRWNAGRNFHELRSLDGGSWKAGDFSTDVVRAIVHETGEVL